MPSATLGGLTTSLVTFACHIGLPSVVKASTSPLSVPTATSVASAPAAAETRLAASIFHAAVPVAGSTRTSVPLAAAA
jgi:hypothetical protein